MTDERTGNEQVAAGDADQLQTGNEVVGDAGLEQANQEQAATEQPPELEAGAEGAEPDEIKGLKAAAAEERRKRQELETQMRFMAMQQQARQQPAGPPPDPFSQAGLTDGDFPTVAQIRAAQQQHAQQIEQLIAQRTFESQNPDFAKVVGAPDPATGQMRYAEPLLKALERDPSLQEDIMYSRNPRRVAYRAAKAELERMQREREAQGPKPEDVNRQLNARLAPMSPASAGGGGAFTAARQIGQMSDDEFARLDAAAAGK